MRSDKLLKSQQMRSRDKIMQFGPNPIDSVRNAYLSAESRRRKQLGIAEAAKVALLLHRSRKQQGIAGDRSD
jgi:hypothetical protein